MSQENVQLVQALLEVFVATGEMSWDLMDEDIKVHDHDVMDAGEYRGRAGVERWLPDSSRPPDLGVLTQRGRRLVREPGCRRTEDCHSCGRPRRKGRA